MVKSSNPAREASNTPSLTERQRKGPSLSALAALATLAVALWLQVDLASALLRAVLVYLGLSMISLAYRSILGRFIAASQAKAQREMLEKIQREAEEEERQKATKKASASQGKTAKEPAGTATVGRDTKEKKVVEEVH